MQKENVQMINKEKMVLNEYVYWTCQWSGAVKVKILEVLDNDKVLVDTIIKNQSPIVRDLEFIFNKEEHAKKSMKDWGRVERKRRREEKAPLKEAKKAEKQQIVIDKLYSIINTIKGNGIVGCFVQITKGTELWGKEILSELGFEDSVTVDILKNGNVEIIDCGQSLFVIDKETVTSVREISTNNNNVIRCKNQFSYTNKENNRVRIYFDYQ